MSKRILLLSVIIISSLSLLCSCAGKKSKKVIEDPEVFRASLTENDTLIVTGLGSQFFGLLNEGSYTYAFEMLSELDDEGRLAYLSDETKEDLKKTFNKPFRYELIDVNFSTSMNNFSRYIIYQGEENNDSFFRFSLSPVKVEGSWYLALRIAPFVIE